MKDTKHPFVPNILNLCIKYLFVSNHSLFSAVQYVNIRCAFLSGSLKLNNLYIIVVWSTKDTKFYIISVDKRLISTVNS